MADLDERLDRLIADQESMRKVLDMAKTILAQRDSAASESATEPAPPSDTFASGPELSSLLSTVLGQQDASATKPDTSGVEQPSQASLQGIPALAAILPQLMQAMSGQGNLIKQERITLLRAMRPYLKDTRLTSIDRAVRMANMTKAATAALHVLGR